MRIKNYSFGSIEINGSKYSNDILIFGNEINEGWWRQEGHSLCMEDISWLLAREPNIIIIGRGSRGVLKVPEKLKRELSQQGYELFSARTEEAVKRYNKLQDTDEDIGAGFHLTC